MSADTMRWLDRWLGVPLCFLLSLLARRRHRAPARPARVLGIQLAEMGSLVLAGPAFHWLRDQGLQPYFVSFARNRQALEISGLVAADRTFLIRTGHPLGFVLDCLRFAAWAWRRRFDAAIDFEPCSRFSGLLALLSGARERAGYRHRGAYRGRLHNRPVGYDSRRHMSENHLNLAAALLPGTPPPPAADAEAAWRRRLPAVDPEAVAAILARSFPGITPDTPLVLLNPNAGDLLPQRRWPADRYGALARRLLDRHPRLRIGLLGAASEAPAIRALAAGLASPRCASLAGDLEVAQLPALFARCRLLVSNDSGPAHLASLSETPTLVLFGPETPGLYRPLGDARALYAALPCSPCIRPENQRSSRCADNRCMQALSVDAVFAAVEERL